MKKNQPSVDGFVPRRPRSPLGELQNLKRPEARVQPIDRSIHTGDNLGDQVGTARPAYTLSAVTEEKNDTRNDISESLQQIGSNDSDDGSRKSRRRRRKQLKRDRKAARPHRKARRIIKWAIIILIVLIIGAVAYVALTVSKAGGNIFNGSILNLVQNQPLKEDSNGRSNFLIVGTSEDDPGHQGSNLTDSMMVLSIDQKNKNAYMISVPRDLYVQYGQACASGYQGKINVFFSCSNDGTTDADEQDRLTQTQQFVGNILGIDIQYGVHVNYTVIRDVINAIGGSITVNIQGDGSVPAGIAPGSVMDGNFDWKCGATYAKQIATCPPRGHFIDYGPGPNTIDAEHALYLAQARGDNGITWGLSRSDFDRTANQQKILLAIKDKATSAGTTTNLGAVTSLISALGDNLRTNIQTSEVRTLMSLATGIKTSDFHSLSLVDGDSAVVTTGTLDNGESIVKPTAGVDDYSGIQAYIAQHLSSDPVIREGANIVVLNGGAAAGAAQTTADALTAKKYIVESVGDAPDGTYAPISIYEITNNKTDTAKALAALYGVKVQTTTPPTNNFSDDTDFVIIVGPAAASSSSSTSQ